MSDKCGYTLTLWGIYPTLGISFKVDLPNSDCDPKTGSSAVIIILYLLLSIFQSGTGL